MTAKQVSAPDDRLGLKLTDGDRARLTVESKVEGVPPATQDSRFLNIRDPYTGVDNETVAKAAADLGGKPEEIIYRENSAAFQEAETKGEEICLLRA